MNLASSLVCIGGLACGAGQSGPVGATPGEEVGTAWPVFRGSRGLHGVAPGGLSQQLELLWSFEAGGAVTSSPVVADGRVYVGSDDGKLHCVDARTGEGLWAFETEDMIEAPPLVVDGRVYIGSSDFFFYALDAKTGELAWKFETDDKILGGANYARVDGKLRIVVGSYDTRLYCFDAETGTELWRYTTENYVNGTPAVLDDRVVFGGCDAVLHVVSITTGEATGSIPLGPDCHIAGSVALADGRVYFGHYGNQFLCVDLAKQELVWSYDSDRHAFFSSPSLGTDRVVFGGRDRHLHCVDRKTGEELWSFPTRRKVDGSPVIAGERVVFGSGDGRVYILALADGKELWTYDVGKAVGTSPAVTDGTIYLGANDGLLYAFGARVEADEKDK